MTSTWPQARSLLQAHGISTDDVAGLHGWSNDVWMSPTHVVRISSGRFRESFRQEVGVLTMLPGRVNVPEVIAHGEDQGTEWMIARRVPGRNLLDAWPELEHDERDRAVRALAANLQWLHDTTLPDNFENPWQTDAVTRPGKAAQFYGQGMHAEVAPADVANVLPALKANYPALAHA